MKVPVLAFLLLFAGSAHAQVSASIGASPAELKALATRTLVVELPEPNQRAIAEFPAKTADAKKAAYENSLASYREQIEPAIRKYWTYNKDIEFKTTSEIIELFKEKNTKYVALLKVVLADGGGAYAYSFGLGVPALVLTATDGASKVSKNGLMTLTNWDFQAYLATTPTNYGREDYSEASMKFTLVEAQKLLEWNTAAGNKRSENFIKYVRDQSEKNCSKLSSKKLLMAKQDLSKKMSPAEAMDSYGRNLELVDPSELESVYLNGDADKAVLFSVPVGIGMGTSVIVEVTNLIYMRVAVDPSTDKILGCIPVSEPPGITKTEMSILKKCK